MTDPIVQLQAAAATGDPHAQFQLGVALARRGSPERAITWFRRAAGAGLAAAVRELGLFQLFAIGCPIDLAKGEALLRQAAAADDADAHYWLAMLAQMSEADDGVDMASAHLRVAASAGHPIALRALGLAQASAGHREQAGALLAEAQQRGDTIAGRLLSVLDAGAAATTASIDLAAAALPMRNGAADDLVVHCSDPYVATCDDVFSTLDCAYAIELGRPGLRPAFTLDPRDGRRLRTDYRTSSSSELEAFQEDPWLRCLQQRLCERMDVPLRYCEPLSLLHYAPGQEYRPHRDYLSPSTLQQPLGVRCGQRRYTAFVYLNDVDAGGETDFPELGVRISPKRGRAVLFHNVKAGGEPDPRTLHAGLPVERGEKWLATLWIRERPARWC